MVQYMLRNYGHNRFGRTYSGFAPNWSETNKVHSVGHSMGGQTVQTLVQLLKKVVLKKRIM